MNLAKLSICPDWPALMDTATAELYLGGSPSKLQWLVEEGYLVPFTNAHRDRTFRREAIDRALAMAAAVNGEGVKG